MNRTTSSVVSKNGAQYLIINGKPTEGLAYLTYLTEHNRYADFAGIGYRLFSMPVFFGSNLLNTSSGLPVFSKGIFDEETPDFTGFDADIARILSACPDGYIFPRVNVNPSRAWELAHPEELCSYADGSDRIGRVSFCSELWMETVKERITALIAHIEQMPYASHIAGYQLAGGDTDEWFVFAENADQGPRGRKAFAAYCAQNSLSGDDTDYYRFLSETIAGRITAFAAHIKTLTGRRLAVGAFYGYSFECYFRTTGHHALQKLLSCADIDFVCSPVSYARTRAAGRNHSYMLPVHSVKLHEKLYFSENDTRTHLSRPVNDMPNYNLPIWFGPDRAQTCEILKMHYARALINGHACWWFDMWGGWYADETYLSLLQKLRKLSAESIGMPMEGCAEVAVFVDENAYAAIADAERSRQTVFEFREALGKMGTPYDLYLASDCEAAVAKFPRYRAVISLVPQPTAGAKQVADTAAKYCRSLLTVTPEHADMTTTALRSFLKDAGVHLYCEHDAVIYANQSYLFLHTVEDGVCSIQTPQNEALFDILDDAPFDPDACRPGKHSYLLRRG